jgi:exodeoxyribonuclease VII large subunit
MTETADSSDSIIGVRAFADDRISAAARAWRVGALCRAAADALDARFNPVTVLGELSGFSRATSGHCYFVLKDAQGQLRCAMFRRAASLMDFAPRDGEAVEVRGRLGVYEPRGDLQLVVESMQRQGVGSLWEEFQRIKAQLEAEGLFESGRKRPIPAVPRGLGVITSTGAAAWHDVVTALQRRAPHLPVFLAPASVQGSGAAAEMVAALERLAGLAREGRIDLILLVRGGGSIEDLWAFNDPTLARALARSPVPVISGVGHETDFTIADFVADLRAPTPTAAAELCATPREAGLGRLGQLQRSLLTGGQRLLDRQTQRLDLLGTRMGRPSSWVGREHARLDNDAQRLARASRDRMQAGRMRVAGLEPRLTLGVQRGVERSQASLLRLDDRLRLLDPALVLRRGYVWLTGPDGTPLTRAGDAQVGTEIQATLGDGRLDLTVQHIVRDAG